MALFVRRFKRFMKKKKGFSRRGQSSKKGSLDERKCFKCDESGHIAINCPNKKKNKNKDDDEKKMKKKFFKNKKKGGKAYLVEWDSDASSDSDDEDDKSSNGLAGIAIKEAPSLFSSPHCLMAKGGKVMNDDDDDDDDDLSYDDLVQMLSEADDYMHKEKEKFKALKKLYKSLQVSFEELKTSHEELKTSHEKLEEAQNSSLVHEAIKPKVDIGVSCDLLDDIVYAPSSSNISCSKCTSSHSSDESSDITKLKKIVSTLTRDLERAYGGSSQLDLCLASQRHTLRHEGLGYVPKKGKTAFIIPKTTFVKEKGKKVVGYVPKGSTNNTRVSFAPYDSCYVLSRNSNGVCARFVGTPILGAKKKAIWVPKTLVTNLQGPKQIWVPKRN
jgi:Zinc knuckle